MNALCEAAGWRVILHCILLRMSWRSTVPIWIEVLQDVRVRAKTDSHLKMGSGVGGLMFWIQNFYELWPNMF